MIDDDATFHTRGCQVFSDNLGVSLPPNVDDDGPMGKRTGVFVVLRGACVLRVQDFRNLVTIDS